MKEVIQRVRHLETMTQTARSSQQANFIIRPEFSGFIKNKSGRPANLIECQCISERVNATLNCTNHGSGNHFMQLSRIFEHKYETATVF